MSTTWPSRFPLLAKPLAFLLSVASAAFVLAQPQDGPGGGGPPPGDPDGGPPRFGFGGPGGPGRGRMGGPGGMGQQKQKLVDRFDKDGDKRLNATERKAAREYLSQQNRGGGFRGRGGFRFGGPPGEEQEPPVAGPKVSQASVKTFPDAPFYDPLVVRTFFLEFEDADWEKELAEFKNTDVEVPARVSVDGKTFSDVGISFRGMSSFMSVGEGRKRSLNLSLDFAHKEQQIGGYRTLNFLNSHEDPTFLRAILSYQIAREYLPSPKANFVRVVINGESWGVYVSVEQFNKDFAKEWFGTAKGARWKVPGSPGGQGNLSYLGDDPAAYKRIYEIKTKDSAKSWNDLIKLCRVLNETPADQLEAALAPILDIDGALRFLALQNALINNDGYWIRTSDYLIYQETNGRFHILPGDSNENFVPAGGPGFGGRGGFGRRGPGAGGGRPGEFGERNQAANGQAGPGGQPGPGAQEGRRGEFPGRGPGGGGFGGGPGGFGGGGGGGVELDPLIGVEDAQKPLISKLLAVPSLRTRYLAYVRDIADKWLDWEKLGPIAERYQQLIAEDVKLDTRKLASTEAFFKGLTEDVKEGSGFGPFGGRSTIGLKHFADQRRKFLLSYSPNKKTTPAPAESKASGF